MKVNTKRLRPSRRWLLPALAAAVLLVGVAGGAAAALETDTVESYWAGVWWSISLITTVGFVGEAPHTPGGAVLSVILMVGGFLLLAMVSASLAALFVVDEERPRDARESAFEADALALLARLEERLERLEAFHAESNGRAASASADLSTVAEP